MPPTLAAELIQSQLKQAGITAELHPTELTQSVKDYFVDKSSTPELRLDRATSIPT
jgi:ABC-type transport system substrate-binding protein